MAYAKYPHQEVTLEIIAAAYEVHQELGWGFLDNAHQAQLLNYLKATGIKVGLILNFGPKRVDVKRMVC